MVQSGPVFPVTDTLQEIVSMFWSCSEPTEPHLKWGSEVGWWWFGKGCRDGWRGDWLPYLHQSAPQLLWPRMYFARLCCESDHPQFCSVLTPHPPSDTTRNFASSDSQVLWTHFHIQSVVLRHDWSLAIVSVQSVALRYCERKVWCPWGRRYRLQYVIFLNAVYWYDASTLTTTKQLVWELHSGETVWEGWKLKGGRRDAGNFPWKPSW